MTSILLFLRRSTVELFAADWLGCNLHNAWAEITLNNNRFNTKGQFEIYGNKTVNKQQIKAQKSLSALILQQV